MTAPSELPPLPEPDSWGGLGYSEEAMRTYALQAQALAPRQLPPPKMTIAGEGPDRGHWWSEDQVRALVGAPPRSDQP